MTFGSRVNTLWASMSIGLALGAAVAAEPPKSPTYGRGNDAYTTSAGIALAGDVVYVTWPSGARKPDRWLAAIDVAQPERPKLLGKLPVSGFPQDVAVIGTHALVVNGLELLVVDISKPEAPALIESLAMADDPVRGPQGIDVKGNMAYVACRRGGVQAVDIGDPLAPKVTTTEAVAGFARDVTVAGDRLYVATDTRGIEVIDIATPGVMKSVGRCVVPRGCVGRILIKDRTAFLAGGDVAVACLSLEDPSHPRWLGDTTDRHLLSPFYGACCHDLALTEVADATTGGVALHACAADGESGLIVVDVSRPEAPAFAGACLEGPAKGGAVFLTGVCMRGRYALAVDEYHGLRVFDVSNPARPTLVGDGVRLAP